MEAIYNQVQSSSTPAQTLGVTKITYQNVRSAYKTLALLLHPDKYPPGKASLHSSLFLLAADAYEELLNEMIENPSSSSFNQEPQPPTPEEIIQTAKALRARIYDAQQRLREAREQACKTSRKSQSSWQRNLRRGGGKARGASAGTTVSFQKKLERESGMMARDFREAEKLEMRCELAVRVKERRQGVRGLSVREEEEIRGEVGERFREEVVRV